LITCQNRKKTLRGRDGREREREKTTEAKSGKEEQVEAMQNQEDYGMHGGVMTSGRDRLIRLRLMLNGKVVVKGKLRYRHIASPGGREAYSPKKPTSCQRRGGEGEPVVLEGSRKEAVGWALMCMGEERQLVV